jgi:hypothetical protein
LEQELEPGEVSRKKPKNAAASPVKIALSAKSIKGVLISECFSHRIKSQKKFKMWPRLNKSAKRKGKKGKRGKKALRKKGNNSPNESWKKWIGSNEKKK